MVQGPQQNPVGNCTQVRMDPPATSTLEVATVGLVIRNRRMFFTVFYLD